MQPHWHKLRWPITALALGSMAYAGLLHITRHPLEVRLVHSFAEPLRLAGRVDAQLNMPQPVQIEPIRAMTVKVSEAAPSSKPTMKAKLVFEASPSVKRARVVKL